MWNQWRAEAAGPVKRSSGTTAARLLELIMKLIKVTDLLTSVEFCVNFSIGICRCRLQMTSMCHISPKTSDIIVKQRGRREHFTTLFEQNLLPCNPPRRLKSINFASQCWISNMIESLIISDTKHVGRETIYEDGYRKNLKHSMWYCRIRLYLPCDDAEQGSPE